MDVTFEDLPRELQSSIFRLLDPIALISFSQTNRNFRSIIDPTRQHFVERLLAIECLEKFGGPAFVIYTRSNQTRMLYPVWNHERIKQMKWACTHCLRLLNHSHFDNHSFLRLGYRKPLPGTQAALPITSWEPNGLIASKTVQERRRAAHKAEMKKLKRQYAIAVTLDWGRTDSRASWARLNEYQDAGIEGFMNLSPSEFDSIEANNQEWRLLDEAVESVEAKICGYKRHLRRCNECRYQLNDLRSHTVPAAQNPSHIAYQAGANLGTKSVPIVKSRQLPIGTFTSRYFPGLFTDLPSWTRSVDNAPTFRIYRQNSCHHYFTTYRIRCPGCATWKEMAAFRCGNLWVKWWPGYRHRWGRNLFKNWDGTPVDKDFIDALRCNSCYAVSHGRDKFAKVLLRWYCQVLVAQLWFVHHRLSLGWGLIWNSVDAEQKDIRPGDWYALKKYHFEIRTEVLTGLPYVDANEPDDMKRKVTYIKADTEMLQSIKQKQKHLYKNWDRWFRQKEKHPTGHPMNDWNDWFHSWMCGYDELEAQWVWLRSCKEELLKRPEVAVEWALGDKGKISVEVLDIWKETTEDLSKHWASAIMEEF